MRISDWSSDVCSSDLFVTSDQSGPLAVTFLHLADYLHRATWGRAGVPPYAFQIQANWIMWLSGHDRLAYLVLSDKRLSVYEVQRNDALIAKTNLAINTMAHAIEKSTPPTMDAEKIGRTQMRERVCRCEKDWVCPVLLTKKKN